MQYAFALVALAAAVTASPFPAPQGVTSLISPSAPAPSCCTAATTGSFGIVVSNITTATSTAHAKRQATQLPDGQPGVGTSSKSFMVVAPVSQINDGQPQGALHTMTMMPVSQIKDGQVQATYMPVTVISDGQPQAPVAPKPTSTAGAVSQKTDGQPQATTSVPKSATSAPASSSRASSVPVSSAPASSAAPVSSTSKISVPASSAPASSVSVSSTLASSGSSSTCATPATKMVVCPSPDTLTLTLANGILKDAKQRTGYIASNFQFQFDDPPQSKAIYTSGFSICANGSLALGGSTTFYQCLSGNFYNLYNTNWAAQCTPVTINYVSFQCP